MEDIRVKNVCTGEETTACKIGWKICLQMIEEHNDNGENMSIEDVSKGERLEVGLNHINDNEDYKIMNEAINIEEILGHLGEIRYTSKGYLGDITKVEEGRVIYSVSNQSLFFLPKGNSNRGFEVSEIYDFKLIRKDNRKHEVYINDYLNREQLENEYIEEREERYKKQEQLRKAHLESRKRLDKESKQKEIQESKSLGGYDELEKDIIEFYEKDGEFYNESFVKETLIPLINKLIHKSISDMSDYPKHYFDKKRNTKFCKMLESKLGIKLKNTQKGNIDILNGYLKNS